MHKVPDENVFSVGYISGCIPILRQYCRRRQLKELDIVDAIAIAMTLNELTGFMFINGIEIKARQKLLRDLKIVEMLIKTLQVPFSESCVKHVNNAAIKKLLKNQSKSALHDYNNIVEPEHQKTMVVVNAAFRVLDSFLKGNSRKNELYISRHVPILWSMFGTEMKVEPMFNELVRDNLQIILLCGEEEIKFIVQLLKENKCADFLEFLSVLSVCDGTPVTEMQNLIGKHLLELKEPPVFLTDVNSAFDGTIDVRGVEGSGQQVNVPVKLHEFAREALDERDDTSTPEYLFLQRQLELYGNLCKGRNNKNIDLITQRHKHLTWEECFLCIQSDSSGGEFDAKQVKAGESYAKKELMLYPQFAPGVDQAKFDLANPNSPRSKADIIIETESAGKTHVKPIILHRLPQSLRSIYVDIISSIFVDVGDNRDVLSEVDLSFDWDTLSTAADDAAANNQTMALSGATFQHFPELKKWIFGVLDKTKEMVSITHVAMSSSHGDVYRGARRCTCAVWPASLTNFALCAYVWDALSTACFFCSVHACACRFTTIPWTVSPRTRCFVRF